MIVVDTNVIAYLFLRGDFASRAEAWWKDDRDWVAPMRWPERVNDFAAPGDINLVCSAVVCGGWLSPLRAG